MASADVWLAPHGAARRKRLLDDYNTTTIGTSTSGGGGSGGGGAALVVDELASCNNNSSSNNNNKNNSNPVKRRCRAHGSSALDAVLRSDVHGFARYGARREALAARALPDAALARLLDGLGGDHTALLRIVDLNLFAPRVAALLADLAVRGTPLAALNVRAHNFSIARKDAVLATFTAAAFPQPDGPERWLRDVVAFVAREFFPEDHSVAISVLSGGGVRDVLVADWCAMYKILPSHVPPQLVIVTAESGRNFLIPYQPEPSS